MINKLALIMENCTIGDIDNHRSKVMSAVAIIDLCAPTIVKGAERRDVPIVGSTISNRELRASCTCFVLVQKLNNIAMTL